MGSDQFDEDYTGSKPMFDSGLGYLILLDNLIKFASGYFIAEMWREYYLTLECWYIEVISRFQKEAGTKKNKGITKETIDKLNTLRNAANSLQEVPLKNYHMELNRLTHLCGLRLKDNNDDPGRALG